MVDFRKFAKKIFKIFGDQDFNQDINLIVILAKKNYLQVTTKWLYAESRIYTSSFKIVSIHFKSYFYSRQCRKSSRFSQLVFKILREYLENQLISLTAIANLNGKGMCSRKKTM